jgi:hypothetical protein
MPQWRHDPEYSGHGQQLALGASMKSAAPFAAALLAAIGFAWPAVAEDSDSTEFFVVGDLLLLPSSWERQTAEFQQARLSGLPGTALQLGDRNGGTGKAVIRTVAPPGDWNERLVALERTPDSDIADNTVGFERQREWISPLTTVPDTPAVAAIVGAQVRSLGADGILVDATAWQHDETLILEVLTIVAGTKPEDADGNLATGIYVLEWTGQDWLLKHALTGRNVDGTSARTLSVMAVAFDPGDHELTLVLRSSMYEWQYLDAYAISGHEFERIARACDGIC